MNFTEWLLEGFSDIIHDSAFLYTLIITVGIFSICTAIFFVLSGKWILLFLEVFTVLYGLYYFENMEM